MNNWQFLIVDDDESFRRSTRRQLWMIGVRDDCISEASSGRDAMDLILVHPFDCVLLDNRMPGGDGVVWIARFLHSRPALAIIMATGAGDESIAVTAMKNGASDYLVKGATTTESLHRSIMNAMEKAAMRQELELQRAALMDAERQRVMVESLGTVCHHMGQPATVLVACLEMLERDGDKSSRMQLVKQCSDAAAVLTEVLKRLQAVCVYRTEPYVQDRETGHEERILAV